MTVGEWIFTIFQLGILIAWIVFIDWMIRTFRK